MIEQQEDTYLPVTSKISILFLLLIIPFLTFTFLMHDTKGNADEFSRIMHVLPTPLIKLLEVV